MNAILSAVRIVLPVLGIFSFLVVIAIVGFFIDMTIVEPFQKDRLKSQVQDAIAIIEDQRAVDGEYPRHVPAEAKQILDGCAHFWTFFPDKDRSAFTLDVGDYDEDRFQLYYSSHTHMWAIDE